VLSTSSRLSDKPRVLRLGAKRYLVKPRTFRALVEMAALCSEFSPPSA
jgi:DNA-binding response OmpR family regulator